MKHQTWHVQLQNWFLPLVMKIGSYFFPDRDIPWKYQLHFCLVRAKLLTNAILDITLFILSAVQLSFYYNFFDQFVVKYGNDTISLTCFFFVVTISKMVMLFKVYLHISYTYGKQYRNWSGREKLIVRNDEIAATNFDCIEKVEFDGNLFMTKEGLHDTEQFHHKIVGMSSHTLRDQRHASAT